MWIQLPSIGFVSLACARKAPGPGQAIDTNKLMLRARKRKHLENLQRACPKLAKFEIIESTGTDYRFRIVAPKKAVAASIAALVEALDYSNTKATAELRSAEVGEDFVHALHRTWSVMHELQTGSYRGGSR
jgi:hypothetical protein